MKKVFLIFISILFFIIILGSIHYYVPNNSFLLPIKKIIPENIKRILKNTFFSIPELKKENQYLKGFYNLINTPNDANYIGFSLEKISLNIYNSEVSQQKPVAYLENINETKMFLVSGIGKTYFFNKESLNKKDIIFEEIDNNLTNLINDKAFWNYDNTIKHSKDIGIRGVLFYQDKVYLSYNKSVSKNCYNTSIISANELGVSPKLSHSSCLTYK